jgi:hypothetical protein
MWHSISIVAFSFCAESQLIIFTHKCTHTTLTCTTHTLQITELQGQVGQLQNALTDAERRVLEGEMVRRKLHNIIQVRFLNRFAYVLRFQSIVQHHPGKLPCGAC